MKIQYSGPPSGPPQVCPRCKGDGYDDEYEAEVCFTCLGEGEVPMLPVWGDRPSHLDDSCDGDHTS